MTVGKIMSEASLKSLLEMNKTGTHISQYLCISLQIQQLDKRRYRRYQTNQIINFDANIQLSDFKKVH